MKTASFHTGLCLTINDVLYKIVRINNNDLFHLEKQDNLALISYQRQDLLSLLTTGELSLLSNNHIQQMPSSQQPLAITMSSLSNSQQDDALKRLQYIRAAIRILGEIPKTQQLEPIIQKVALEMKDPNPPSPITLYRWWQKWHASDHDFKALVNQKRGPTNLRKNTATQTMLAIFEEVVDEVYLTKERHSKQATYNTFLSQIQAFNARSTMALKPISRATFYRLLSKLDAHDVSSAREGRRTADQRFRKTGLGVVTQNILERAEIDHTPLDVMIIDDESGLTNGRPYLTVVLDIYSRMPLGIEIGFEPPSELSVMRALRHAVFPKINELAHMANVKNDWPAYGIPTTLVCDNGLEFHSQNLRRMAAELNIELFFCPRKEPNYKGCVERFLGTLNRQVCHRLPGTTFGSINERGEYESIKRAAFNLEELKAMVHQWITTIYSQDLHRSINTTPSAQWQEGLQRIEPRLPGSKQALDLILTKEYRRHLSHEGIRFFLLCYNSDTLRQLRIQHGPNIEVAIRVNPDDLGAIWVHDVLNESYVWVPCTNPAYANQLSLLQHRAICKQKKEQGLSVFAHDALLEAQEQFRLDIQKTSKQSKLIRHRSKLARLKPNPLVSQPITKSAPPETNMTWPNLDHIPDFDTVNDDKKEA